MIKPSQFTILAGSAVVSTVLALGAYWSSNQWASGRVSGTLLMPDLAKQLATTGAVEISQGEKRLTLERQGENWRIKERAGYPANTERVRALLAALATTELVEPRTSSKEKHKLLELEEPTTKDAKSRFVRVLDQTGKPIGEIVVGKSRFDAFGAGKPGVYVRRQADARTWLAAGDPKTGLELRDWATTNVFERDQAKIARVEISHAGEEPLVVTFDEKEKKFALDKMPEGKKLKQGVTIDQIPQGFASIDLEDVRKLEQTPAGDHVSIIKLTGNDGLTVTFRIRKDGDAHWLSLEAKGEGDAKKAADELTARATGWEYKIPQWKAEQIGKRRADLFETS